MSTTVTVEKKMIEPFRLITDDIGHNKFIGHFYVNGPSEVDDRYDFFSSNLVVQPGKKIPFYSKRSQNPIHIIARANIESENLKIKINCTGRKSFEKYILENIDKVGIGFVIKDCEYIKEGDRYVREIKEIKLHSIYLPPKDCKNST